MSDNKQVKVGIGVFIKKGHLILWGLRKGSHGSGTWAIPGGSLHYGESPEVCAIREVEEEVGIKIKNIKLGPFTSDFFKSEGKHFITLWLVADYDSGEVELKEPEKSEKWEWRTWDNIPSPLFLSEINLFKTGFNPLKDE